MTITAKVQQQFFSAPEALIRLPPTVMTNYAVSAVSRAARVTRASRPRTNLWTVEEHESFLCGLEQFPQGPWKEIAAIVGTKTTRQTMTHAQKYREKIERRQRSRASATEATTVLHNTTLVPASQNSAPSMNNSDRVQTQLPAVFPSVDKASVGVASPLHAATTSFFSSSPFDEDLDQLIDGLGIVPTPVLSESMAASYAF